MLQRTTCEIDGDKVYFFGGRHDSMFLAIETFVVNLCLKVVAGLLHPQEDSRMKQAVPCRKADVSN